ncbi:acyltransferase [Arthrobacter sp.]|uniref:acyltransferase n=1 Tax=Arthrobacter sp. TaxID=1667 RepID=UPI003A8FE4A8
MSTLTEVSMYEDDRGNRIISPTTFTQNVRVDFKGSNNTLIVDPTAKIASLRARFDCDNGVLELGGKSPHRGALRADARVGQDSSIRIGKNVTTTKLCILVAVEGTSLTLGDDVMIASDVGIRTDDAHPIFDVESGRRINWSQDVHIGNHVWIANRAIIRPGTSIGNGSVVGMNSLAKGKFPNNCIIAGTPARVVRRNVAWERPHLSNSKPFYKPDASTVKKSGYWNPTEDEARPVATTLKRWARIKRRARHHRRQLAGLLRN